MLASGIMEHITDHPWPGCQTELFGMRVTLMSSGIAAIIVAATLVAAVVLVFARRRQMVPSGGRNVLEMAVVFVRDRIARPALHDRADAYMPLLLTMFVLVLGMNLVKVLPLDAVSALLAPAGVPPVGGAPTAILTVCGGLAGITLLSVIASGLVHRARLLRAGRKWPWAACCAASPLAWLNSLSPKVPGAIGMFMKLPLTFLEIVGLIAKCFALMIRLFANMLSGHTLLAVMMWFVLRAATAWWETHSANLFYIAPMSIFMGAVVDIMELVVGLLQAYIFTFLSAIFLGIFAEAEGH